MSFIAAFKVPLGFLVCLNSSCLAQYSSSALTLSDKVRSLRAPSYSRCAKINDVARAQRHHRRLLPQSSMRRTTLYQTYPQRQERRLVSI